MELGVATHFSQGWPLEIVEAAQEIGVDSVRDALTWPRIEQQVGSFTFLGPESTYPDLLALEGIDLQLVFAHTNSLYDQGFTPHTPEGREAFANFVAEALQRHPFVRIIEIGNEYNSQTFVTGPVAAAYEARAEHYIDLLKAVDAKVSVEFPDVTILSGAAHSIPVEFLQAQVQLGSLEHSDGIALHPYTSPPEKVGVHLDMLRAALAPADPPIHATEIGATFDSFDAAAPYLVKMTTALSASGAASAFWYSLREQDALPRMELLAKDGAPKPAADAFALVKERLLPIGDAGRLVSDPYTYLYAFGQSAVVAWGVPQDITIRGEVEWRDSQGRDIPPPQRLDPDEPVIAFFDDPADLATAVTLGPHDLLADSFYDFDPRLDAEGRSGNWTFEAVRSDGTVLPLTGMGGGGRQSEAWRPYVGSPLLRPLGVSEDVVRPVDFTTPDRPGQAYQIRETFVAPDAAKATVCGVWDVRQDTTDGVTLTLHLDGRTIHESVVTDVLHLRIDELDLGPGSRLEILTGPNADPTGDRVRRHVRIAGPSQADALCSTLRETDAF
ncbi:hypothetical protein [uncultured Jannaschia sp.]|uniref:hypothetical protein n=1 Tax=uncultured Jannaschia sp. TaxID=293347 RepID=UPI00260E8B2D|nr:hypothetical protein [uncultured Jannaschia sp.]